MTLDSFDSIVVGAGPAGIALALELSRLRLRVAVLDAGREESLEVGETLAGRALPLLQRLGLYDGFLRQGQRPVHARQSIWGSHALHELSSMFDPYGGGFHLDRARWNAWLWQCAKASHVVLVRPARVRRVSWCARDSAWTLRCTGQGPDTLEARWLVDATGHGAWLARRLGGQRDGSSSLVGVARWFSGTDPNSPMLIEAAPEGWWYSAPVPGKLRVAVWMTDPGSPAARATEDERWRSCLSTAPETLARLAGASVVGRARTRLTGPALTLWGCERPWLPVGDARYSLDPLSGDGLRSALESGLEASEVIAAPLTSPALLRYRDRGYAAFAQHLLQRREIYASERRFERSSFWARARQMPTRSPS